MIKRLWMPLGLVGTALLLTSSAGEAQDRADLYGAGIMWHNWFNVGDLPPAYQSNPHTYDTAQMQLIKDMGGNNCPGTFDWCGIETTQGTYNWTDADQRTDDAYSKGLHIYAYIGNTPDWALPAGFSPGQGYRTPPDDIYQTQFENYCRAVAERYAGKVEHFTFWNEPNGCSWVNDGCANGNGYALYVHWLKIAYGALKEGNPNCLVGAGSLDCNEFTGSGCWDYVDGMYAQGAQGYFDAIALHPYASTSVYWDAITNVRAKMLANGDGDKGIWLNEYGWYDSGAGDAPARLTNFLNQVKQPDYAYVTMCNYLVVSDLSDGSYGLCNHNLTPRPIYSAMQSFNKTPLPTYTPGPVCSLLISQGKTASVDSTFSGSYPASKLTDGLWNCDTCRWVSGSGSSHWCYLDLGASYDLCRVDVYPDEAWNGAGSLPYNPTSYTVRGSVTGSGAVNTWTTLATFSNTCTQVDYPGGVGDAHNAHSVSGTYRYVGLHITGNDSACGSNVRVQEVQIFSGATPSNTPTRTPTATKTNTPTRTPTLTGTPPTSTPTNTASNTPTNTPTTVDCQANPANGDFEQNSGAGSVPTGWTAYGTNRLGVRNSGSLGGIAPYEGSWSVGNETYDNSCAGGIYRIYTVANGTCRAGAYITLLASTKTSERLRIGIDKDGGASSAGVDSWSGWAGNVSPYSSQWVLLQTGDVTVTGGQVTIFLDHDLGASGSISLGKFDAVRLSGSACPPTNTSTRTPTGTSTNTPTRTRTNTPTNTPTRTRTNTPTNTPTRTATPTNTPTNTPTATCTPSNLPTNTPSDTPTTTGSPLPATPTSTATVAGAPTDTPLAFSWIDAASVTVDASGGTLNTGPAGYYLLTTLALPAGSLSAAIVLSVSQPDNNAGTRNAAQFDPDGLGFVTPATMTIEFREDEVPADHQPQEMRLHWYDPVGGSWELVSGPQVVRYIDSDRWTVSARIYHLSMYGARIPLPSFVREWRDY